MADLEFMERHDPPGCVRLAAIKGAARVLLNMLSMADAKPAVTWKQANALWKNVKDETGYAAVNAFLNTCADIDAIDGDKADD